MSELSRALGGPPFKIILKEKTYNVGLITGDIKIAYEKEMYAQAIRAVGMQRQFLSEDDYKAMMKELAAQYSRGEFAMEGEEGRRLFNTTRGLFLITGLLLGVDQGEVLTIMLEDGPQVSSVIEAVIKDSFPGVNFDDPKAKAG